jgi:hypothetical protein
MLRYKFEKALGVSEMMPYDSENPFILHRPAF